MKKKDIQQKYNISERLFWKLIALDYIKRMSYRDYEIDEVYFATFSVAKFWEEYKQRPEVKEKQNLANKKRSDTMKRVCSNEEYRKQMSEKAKVANAKPEVRQKISQSVKKAFENPEVRLKMSNSVKQALSSPETKAKLSMAQKALWQNEKYRKKMSKVIKKSYDENPEIKAKISASISKTLLEKWKDETWRNNRIAKMHSEYYSEALSNGIKNHYLDEEKKKATLNKSYMTKKQNNTFNVSQPEQCIKELLEQKFNKVYYQYKSELYPFNCDFYVEDLNLYIECHFNWTHGSRSYNENEQCCIEQLNNWKEKAKTSKYYQNAIYTWTDLDVRKRQCAISNKLNWIAFYDWHEFEQWMKNYE